MVFIKPQQEILESVFWENAEVIRQYAVCLLTHYQKADTKENFMKINTFIYRKKTYSEYQLHGIYFPGKWCMVLDKPQQVTQRRAAWPCAFQGFS